MSTTLLFLRTPLAYLALAAVLGAGAKRAIVIPEYPEIYTAAYDDTTAPESEMRVWLLLSPLVGTDDPDNNFEMARSSERTAGNKEKLDKVFYAIPIEKCDFPGCADHPEIDQAWLANAMANLEATQRKIERLAHMKLPVELEPVRAYLLSGLRFSFDLERRRFDYVRTGKLQPLQETLAAACAVSKPDDQKLFHDLAAASLSQRLEVSKQWFTRLLLCQRTKGSYPIPAWQAFLKKYGVSEATTFEDPDWN